MQYFYDTARYLSCQKKFSAANKLLKQNRHFILKEGHDPERFHKEQHWLALAKKEYSSLMRMASDDKSIRVLPVFPRILPDEKSDIAHFNIQRNSRCHCYESQEESVELQKKDFENIHGLLAQEERYFSAQIPWKTPLYKQQPYQVWAFPNACPGMISLDGFYLKNAVCQVSPMCLTNLCAIPRNLCEFETGFLVPYLGGYSENQNHYHCLMDSLPTLMVYKELQLDCPIILPFAPNAFNRTLLDAMEIAQDKLITASKQHAYLFKTGICVIPESLKSQRIVQFYDNIASDILAKNGSPLQNLPKKIYISRKKADRRRLLNEAEVECEVQKFGFSVVQMEDLSLEEQIRLMREVSFVIAPHGAGLTNLLFCKKNPTVVELMHRHIPSVLFRNISLLNECDYYPFLGEKANIYEWKVDCGRLARVIEQLAKRMEHSGMTAAAHRV